MLVSTSSTSNAPPIDSVLNLTALVYFVASSISLYINHVLLSWMGALIQVPVILFSGA